MDYKEYLGSSFNLETGEFNHQYAQEMVWKEKTTTNIVLLGATGVGKSALVNAIFGDNIVDSQAGKPVTQFLQKIEIPNKGITLWDTKGIEAQDYITTKSQLIDDIKDGFQKAFSTKNINEFPHIAWLCIKESSARIEPRDQELLEISKSFKIPTVIVFTDKLAATDKFVEVAIKELSKNHGDFIKNRFVRVNTVPKKIDAHYTYPVCGLEELITKTEECYDELDEILLGHREECKKAFLIAQTVNNKKRLSSMIDSAKNKVHYAAIAAGTVGLSPIPGSDAPIIAAIQSTMIYKINTDFELALEENTSISLITGILGVTAIAQVGKTVVNNLIKFIPVAGAVVGGVIGAATATAITEAVG
ncbi:GTPase, partial [Pasteurella multocida]